MAWSTCLTRDFTCIFPEFNSSILDARVFSSAEIITRSCRWILAIICSAVRETSRLAFIISVSRLRTVCSKWRIMSLQILLFSFINSTSAVMLAFSLLAALSSAFIVWFSWPVLMHNWQTQVWHSSQKNLVISCSWWSWEQKEGRFNRES